RGVGNERADAAAKSHALISLRFPLVHGVADVAAADAALHAELEGVEQAGRDRPIEPVRQRVARELALPALNAEARVGNARGIHMLVLQVPASVPRNLIRDL